MKNNSNLIPAIVSIFLGIMMIVMQGDVISFAMSLALKV